MSDNTNQCVYVSSMLSQNSTSADFTRSLQVKLSSLNFNDDTTWIQTDHVNHLIPSPSPLSPETEEQEKPLNFVKNLEDGLNDLRNKINGHIQHDFENLGSSSSADELYETASDNSNNEEEIPTRNSVIQDDGDDSTIINDQPKIRRCSSLKTGKTPPGTPGCKKIVRFADALGLDLADVKTFVDEIPKIPTSAYHDLKTFDDSNTISNEKSLKIPEKSLVPLFEQPASRMDFLELIREHYVALENSIVEDQISFLIKGIVRVRNIDFHKSVFVRYSIDKWKTHVDIKANYVENSCDGFSDKFTFIIYANMLNVGDTLEFAVLFQARGEQFWDNNSGSNYCFHCISTKIPVLNEVKHVVPSLWDEQWGAAFY